MREIDREDKLRAQTPATQYDKWYQGTPDVQGAYDAYMKSYWNSHYYPLYRSVLEEVLRLGGRSVLEVGCGSGSFAHLLMDRTSLSYYGFDFSEVAIRQSGQRTARPECFGVSHAGDSSAMERPHDTVVCLEVLEHIENDLDVVSGWKPGVRCICSVPNFDQPDHVRFFS